MTDRELLEAAAKAAGLEFKWEQLRGGSGRGYARARKPGTDAFPIWRPLEDDGDALRLLAKLRLDVLWAEHTKGVVVANDSHDGDAVSSFVKSFDDSSAAVRLAIVRAAAELADVPPNVANNRSPTAHDD